MPAPKEPVRAFQVIRPFSRTDSTTGRDVHFDLGATYDGADIEKYLEWPGGPLIKDVTPVGPAAGDEGEAS